MFPRVALVILGVLILLIGTVVFVGHIQATKAHHDAACYRGIARPYEQLLARMHELAEAGKIDELRALISGAQQHSGDILSACKDEDDAVYSSQVEELMKSNQSLQPTASPHE